MQMGAQQAPPGLGPILEDQARPPQNLVRTLLAGSEMGEGRQWGVSKDIHRSCPFPSLPSLSASSSSVHRSPSLRALWGPLGLQGSPSPKVPPRPLLVPPKALLEQPLAHPLLDPSFGPRTRGPTPSCGASSSIPHR
jgi:hypothetical protein